MRKVIDMWSHKKCHTNAWKMKPLALNLSLSLLNPMSDWCFCASEESQSKGHGSNLYPQINDNEWREKSMNIHDPLQLQSTIKITFSFSPLRCVSFSDWLRKVSSLLPALKSWDCKIYGKIFSSLQKCQRFVFFLHFIREYFDVQIVRYCSRLLRRRPFLHNYAMKTEHFSSLLFIDKQISDIKRLHSAVESLIWL